MSRASALTLACCLLLSLPCAAATDSAQSQNAVTAKTEVTANELFQDYQKHPTVSNEPHKALTPSEKAKLSVTDADGKTVTVTPPAPPKPKPSLVSKPPLPKYYMRIPQTGDFTSVSSVAGDYSLLMPKVFGTDPLSELPALKDAMLLRSAADDLLCATVMLDAQDSGSYNSTQALPSYPEKRLLCRWQHGRELIWNCSLSRHDDYYGDKYILEARTERNGKTYQQLYVFPQSKLYSYLPQALQAIDSFKINQ